MRELARKIKRIEKERLYWQHQVKLYPSVFEWVGILHGLTIALDILKRKESKK